MAQTKTEPGIEIARLLLNEKIFQFSQGPPLKFASGIISPVYCDNRLLLSKPQQRYKIVQHFRWQAERFAPLGAIAGTATAGIPWASWLAQELNLPLVYVRGKAKEHGKQRTVEGGNVSGKRTLLIEDLITTGGSSIAAATNLEEAGAELVGVLAIFSYGFKDALEKFSAADVEWASLTNLNYLMQAAEQDAVWDTDQLKQLRSFSADPWNWQGTVQ